MTKEIIFWMNLPFLLPVLFMAQKENRVMETDRKYLVSNVKHILKQQQHCIIPFIQWCYHDSDSSEIDVKRNWSNRALISPVDGGKDRHLNRPA